MNISVVATERLIDAESIIETTQSDITYPETLDKEVIATAISISESATMYNSDGSGDFLDPLAYIG